MQTSEYMNQNDFFLDLAFAAAKVVIYQSIHSSDLARFLTRALKFSRLSNKFGFFVQHLTKFLFSFSFVFFFNSILCQIYWIPDLQSLKLVCFMVANSWNQKYADSRLFWQDGDVYIIEEPPVSPTCENTSNSGWVPLIVHLNIELSSKRTADEF